MSDPGFPWHTLQAIIGGASPLDVPRLRVSDERSAEAFLECYGFEWTRPAHRDELERIRREALEFLEEELLPEGLVVPAALREQHDPRALLVAASGEPTTVDQRWACALLRLMHVVAHAGSQPEEIYGPSIRRQVMRRFDHHLREDPLRLGDGEDEVLLEGFEARLTKPRRSLLMKLLHKPENVASDIFDRLGVRFITRDRLDALRVVRYLRVHNVVMFANVKPTRSRNGLVPLEELRVALDALEPEREAMGLVAWEEALREQVEAMPFPQAAGSVENPFSSTSYRAIQFTCRQLVRVPNPLEPGAEVRFFFPYEVQVLDLPGFLASRTGRASHGEYKQRQREVARRRVLGTLLEEG